MQKVLIANRSEIARRVIRSCRELDLETVAVYSDADAEALHVREADEAVAIGKPHARASYLNVDKLIDAARKTGADAIHPGYGFLSESARFAEACEAAGLTFVGPPAKAIAAMGDKAAARRLARDAGVPAAAREAEAAFGDPSLYLEKLLERARHVEIQVMGDGHGNVIHLFERECSLQRRRQKLVEESPSPALEPSTREAMADAAVRLARAVGYTNAGTVEFLVDEDERFYFIEMNTRLQVEHGVTEMVTGTDLVREQLLVAAGEAVELSQDDVTLSGSAVEFRINAEDPDSDFQPAPGRIEALELPGGPGVRVDTAIYSGYTVAPFYDSLIAKLLVWAPTRRQALLRGLRALDEFKIEGIATTIPLHVRLVQDEQVLAGDFHTGYLEELLAPEREAA